MAKPRKSLLDKLDKGKTITGDPMFGGNAPPQGSRYDGNKLHQNSNGVLRQAFNFALDGLNETMGINLKSKKKRSVKSLLKSFL